MNQIQMYRENADDAGGIFAMILQHGQRAAGITMNRQGGGIMSIAPEKLGEMEMFVHPAIDEREGSVFHGILIDEIGDRILITGGSNLPIGKLCEALDDKFVREMRERQGIFCSIGGRASRVWLVCRMDSGGYEYRIMPDSITDIRFGLNGSLIGRKRDEPGKLYRLSNKAVNRRDFSKSRWILCYTHEGPISNLAWRTDHSGIIGMTCEDGIIWAEIGTDGKLRKVNEFRTEGQIGDKFVFLGTTNDGRHIFNLERGKMVRGVITTCDFSEALMKIGEAAIA